jgi:small subunit ribosomal protein S17
MMECPFLLRIQSILQLTTVNLLLGLWSVKGQKTEFKENTGGTEMRDIGIDVIEPKGEWDGDSNCPFYGSLRVRGQIIEGTVSRVGMLQTIVVEREHTRHMKKFERIEKRTRRYSAHLPSCIGDVNVGDAVRIMECRPISKTVTFCVIERGDSE